MTTNNQHASSFRDPSGYIFMEEGILKRLISPIYFDQYSALKSSGFYEKLFKAQVLIPHKELSASKFEIILQPEQIPFITYPYEWSFNQFKEAALLTLKLQKFSLEHGFSLKDASAFNIAFYNGKAVFIDTLSFDFYQENSPWRAYKQFIEHFFGPLLLAHFHGAKALKLSSIFMDGIPVKMLSSMLPFKTKFNPIIYSNVHLLSRFENKHNEDYKGKIKASLLSKKAQLNIIESLYGFIKKFELKEQSEWGNYYCKTNYTDAALNDKAKLINHWIDTIKPETLIDVGGNDGTFVRRIHHKFKLALVCDIDNTAVDLNFQNIKQHKEQHIVPFVLDILNPSAAIGFQNKERQSFLDRIKVFNPEITLALALIHHVSLSGNVTFNMSAQFFATFSNYLIIEFPKREDSWVERLLNTKGEFRNHFDFYNEDNFEMAYKKYFQVVEKVQIEHSNRILYCLKNKDAQ